MRWERDWRDVLGAGELRNTGAAARAEGMMGRALLHESAG
jgi:hypothetical protein